MSKLTKALGLDGTPLLAELNAWFTQAKNHVVSSAETDLESAIPKVIDTAVATGIGKLEVSHGIPAEDLALLSFTTANTAKTLINGLAEKAVAVINAKAGLGVIHPDDQKVAEGEGTPTPETHTEGLAV